MKNVTPQRATITIGGVDYEVKGGTWTLIPGAPPKADLAVSPVPCPPKNLDPVKP